MPTSLNDKIHVIDEHIKHGRGDSAKAELKALKKVKVPRESAAALASVAWRAGMPSFGIRVLNPLVRPHRRSPVEPTDEEKAVYAQCLNRIGASEEALGILDHLDPAELPQVYFFKATSLISRWDYEATITLWEKYIRAKGVSTYQQLVGKLNLAAALVYTSQFKKSTPLLRELLYETSLRKLDLIFGNALEISAQNYVLQENWAEAERCLERAEQALSKTGTIDEFFVRKWRAFIGLLRDGVSDQTLSALAQIRRESIEKRHWETWRQCDRFEATSTKQRTSILKVYFGTPYHSFRKNFTQELGGLIDVPPDYLWHASEKTDKSPKWIIDAKSGIASPGEISLREGHVLHRLLAVLVQDFYRSLRTAAVHFQINPDEFFNPITSPPRVHEAVKRLRAWFVENDIPMNIEEQAGFYRLVAEGSVAIRVKAGIESIQKHSSPVEKLKQMWGGKAFSLREASQQLGIPDRTLHRILEQAMQEGRIVRTGQSRATRYAFPQRAA